MGMQNKSPDDEIISFYNLGLEAGRLSEPRGELEYIRTQEIIQRYLPPPPAVIWDIGGGPGRYANWLARLGYKVHLLDPVELHLMQARDVSQTLQKHSFRTFVRGDARNLPVPSKIADVALLLGPLYHLTERKDRLCALGETWRVLSPGGLLFAAGISRFASSFVGLFQGHFEDSQFFEIANEDIETGQHRNPSLAPDYFTTAFFHHPNELADEVTAAGFHLEALLSVEGLAVFLQDLDNRWKDSDFKARLLAVTGRLETESSLLGATGHLLAVGKKLSSRHD